jgi:hypothetical protein
LICADFLRVPYEVSVTICVNLWQKAAGKNLREISVNLRRKVSVQIVRQPIYLTQINAD